mgnify:FL=1
MSDQESPMWRVLNYGGKGVHLYVGKLDARAFAAAGWRIENIPLIPEIPEEKAPHA